jgi:hypothetical protein
VCGIGDGKTLFSRSLLHHRVVAAPLVEDLDYPTRRHSLQGTSEISVLLLSASRGASQTQSPTMSTNFDEKKGLHGDKDVSAIPAPYVDVTEENTKTQASTTTSDENDVAGKETSSPADTLGKGSRGKDEDDE